MKFLATGDIQAHNWSQFSYIRKDGMNSRLYNCLEIFRILRHEAKKRGITRVLLNGDVIEENAYIETEVYTGVYDELEKLHKEGLEVVINVGNHDILRESDGRIIHALRPFRKVAHVVETPTMVWGHLWVVPWIENPDKFKKTIADLYASGEGDYALALHVGVSGAKTGPTGYLLRSPIKLKDLRRRDFSVVILSDYHTRQRLASNVFYLGSPLQHSFGEIHRPCIWEIDLDGRDYAAKKIYTDLPTFKRVSIGNGEDIGKLERKSKDLAGNYVRIELRPGSKVSDRSIEEWSKDTGALVQIERRGEQRDSTEPDVRTIQPEEAIKRYVKENAKERYQKRLRKLGEKIYSG
jgi:DNA repair exonuclease SbcCD nuclease subunit